MSIHQVECAAALNLPASTKLALMAFADSADKDTRVAFPGLDNVMTWAGLRKSRTLEVVAWLVQRGYLARVTGSKPGQRAEYLVFPAGCCAQHGPLNGYATPDPFNGYGPADPKTPDGSGPPDVNNSDGSGPPDVNNLDGSDCPDANGSAGPDPWAPNGSDLAGNGSDPGPEWVRSGPDPSPPPPSVPPPPPARETEFASSPPAGGGGGDGDPRTRRVFDALGDDWALSGGQRERLGPLVASALCRGWDPEALAAHLDTNAGGVRNPYAVLRSRLADLPDPHRHSRPAAPRPAWCGTCDQNTRLRDNDHGLPSRCPDCHPLHAPGADHPAAPAPDQPQPAERTS